MRATQAAPIETEILEGLGRLLSAASMYAPDHARVVAAARPLALLIADRATDDAPCVVEVVPEGLALDGVPVPTATSPLQRLRRDLDALGTATLEFSRAVTSDDLIQLVRSVRIALQRRGERTRFGDAVLSGLPPSVAARQSDFGSPSFGRAEEGVVACGVPSTGSLPRLLGKEPTPEEWKGLTAEFARRLLLLDGGRPRAVPGDPTASTGAGAVTDLGGPWGVGVAESSGATTLPEAAWGVSGLGVARALEGPLLGIAPQEGRRAHGLRERLRALEEALRRALERSIDPDPKARSVERVVEEARQGLLASAAAAETEFVLEGLRLALDAHLRDAFRSEPSVARGPSATSKDGIAYEMPLPSLVDVLMRATAGLQGACGAKDLVDPGETLSILLHLLDEDRRPGVVDGILGRLLARLSRPLEPRETAVVAQWIRSLCSAARGPERVDRLLPIVFGPLRRCAPVAVPLAMLAAFDRRSDATLHALWPHIAVEVVQGLEGLGPGDRDALVGHLASVSHEAMVAQADRFAALLREGAVVPSSRLLAASRTALHVFYEMVLDRSDVPGLSRMVVEAFREDPPPMTVARALMAPGWDGRERGFLTQFLRERRLGRESPGLHDQAARVVVTALRGLPRARRRETWVSEAVGALGSIDAPAARDLLREVATARRFPFRWEWPSEARRAAVGAQAERNLAAQGLVRGVRARFAS